VPIDSDYGTFCAMVRDGDDKTPRSGLHVSLGSVLEASGAKQLRALDSPRSAPISGDELRVLLDTIDRTGSIGRAAREVERSYRHAWDVLGRASTSYGASLVETTTGGRSGGGTRLSEDGRTVLRRLKDASAELEAIVSRPAPVTDQPPAVMVASTLEVLESGLGDTISRRFFTESGIRVGFIGAGSGEALSLASHGRVDATITHAPSMEREFMRNGWGERGLPVMQGHFVLVGPADDPAGVERVGPTTKERSIVSAFEQIARAGSIFFSRSDQSGTHLKEMELWHLAGIEPKEPWYQPRVGFGNREILQQAADRGGYALIDAATLHAIGLPGGLTTVWRPGSLRTRGNQSHHAVTHYTMTTVRQTVIRDAPAAVDRRAGWARQLSEWLDRSMPAILIEDSRGSRDIFLFQPI
jgi:tungstate transport system substrate-binding protein